MHDSVFQDATAWHLTKAFYVHCWQTKLWLITHHLSTPSPIDPPMLLKATPKRILQAIWVFRAEIEPGSIVGYFELDKNDFWAGLRLSPFQTINRHQQEANPNFDILEKAYSHVFGRKRLDKRRLASNSRSSTLTVIVSDRSWVSENLRWLAPLNLVFYLNCLWSSPPDWSLKA